MAIVRALRFGVDHRGGGRQPGDTWDHGDRPIGSWMEVVEQNASPSPKTQEPHVSSEAASEDAAPAEANKRQLRNRKVAPKES